MKLTQIRHTINVSTEDCSIGNAYKGNVCFNNFQLYNEPSNCSENSVSNVAVTDQESVEEYLVGLLHYGLPAFYPSPECSASATEFFCNFFFRKCTENGTVEVTREDCEVIRDDKCSSEWKELEQYFYLPQCEDLPRESQQGEKIKTVTTV